MLIISVLTEASATGPQICRFRVRVRIGAWGIATPIRGAKKRSCMRIAAIIFTWSPEHDLHTASVVSNPWGSFWCSIIQTPNPNVRYHRCLFACWCWRPWPPSYWTCSCCRRFTNKRRCVSQNFKIFPLQKFVPQKWWKRENRFHKIHLSDINSKHVTRRY